MPAAIRFVGKVMVLVVVLSFASCFTAWPASAAETGNKEMKSTPSVTERIAVIRIKDVIEKYRRFKILDRKLKRRFKRKLLNIENRRKEMKEEREALGNVETPEDLDNVLALERKIYELREEYQSFYKTVNALELKMARALFEDIRREIEIQAKKKEAAHVLSVLTLTQVAEEASSLEELVFTYRTTPVLYFDSKLDLTDDVLAALNENYDEKNDIFIKTENLEELLTPEDIKQIEEAIKRKEGGLSLDEGKAGDGGDMGQLAPSAAPAAPE